MLKLLHVFTQHEFYLQLKEGVTSVLANNVDLEKFETRVT